ncbi:uncharacterized protein LOC141620687 [Silene latifolia]|uniref:uncharacterized protein LOC141620687 n=1 Tax=Silene latifolia TaxID=37657 RepID=UPI003D77DE05
MVVAELLKPNGREWDAEKVGSLLLPFEMDRVLNIQVSPNGPCDAWYWDLEREGDYSVKMAYAALAGEMGDKSGSSDWEKESKALAATDNIATRVKGEYSLCYLCSAFNESCLHLFRDCGVAKWAWNGLGLSCEEEGVECGVREWIEHRWRELAGVESRLFMLGCWALWEHRNKAAFEGAMVDPKRAVRRVKDVVFEMDEGEVDGKRRLGKGHGGVARQEQGGWRTAEAGYVKVNVDAGVKE